MRPYVVVGDAIPASLTGAPGDPERGREIVGNRQVGLCLLCHTGPFPAGALSRQPGALISPAPAPAPPSGSCGYELLMQADSTPNTIMPPYYRVDGLTRVAASYRGKPILSAEQIEDVVAFLVP